MISNLSHLDQALKTLARNNFTFYKRLIWRRYARARHLDLLDRALMLCEQYVTSGGKEGIGRLMVSMPPRHGKSQTISRLYPSWFLGRNPDYRVILASYGSSLAEQHSRYARAVIGTKNFEAVFPGVKLSQDTRGRDEWALAFPSEGGFSAVGVGGAVTGKGGHIIIVDDPVKSRAEAESETMREKIWDWYNSDLFTRAEPGAAIISVMTRWHMDDLNGRLLRYQGDAAEGGQWLHICFPAIAQEAGDALGRAVGEALWPERYPIEVLEQIKANIGAYPYASLYGQNPIPAEGGLFKRDNFIQIDAIPPRVEKWVRFWDLALSEKTSADFTTGVLFGQDYAGNIIVADLAHFHAEWDDVPNRIEEVALKDGPKIQIGVEEAFYQTRAVKQLLLKPKLHDYSIKGFKPEADKFTRALPFAARVGERLVYVVRAAWTEDFLSEMCSFPLAPHDDIVDACSGAYMMLDKSRRSLEVTTQKTA